MKDTLVTFPLQVTFHLYTMSGGGTGGSTSGSTSGSGSGSGRYLSAGFRVVLAYMYMYMYVTG